MIGNFYKKTYNRDSSNHFKSIGGNHMKRAILFIHGIVGHPNQFRLFDPFIPQNVDSYYLLLKGHGGSVDDFAKATMEDWQKQVDEKIEELSNRYDAIYLVGHSMGTLFGLQRMNHPRVKGLFLLAVPLSIGVKFRPFLATAHYVCSNPNNPNRAPADPKIGVKPDPRLWKYIKWLPNLHSLLKEIRRTRKLIKNQTPKIPCVIFQSAKDELVSHKTAKLLEEAGYCVRWLKHSAHHVYTAEDTEILKQAFCRWILGTC